MDNSMYTYRDRQMQDLASHRSGCGTFSLFFIAVAFIIFLCSLIDDHPMVGLISAGIVLLIGGVIIGISYREYLKKQKELDK